MTSAGRPWALGWPGPCHAMEVGGRAVGGTLGRAGEGLADTSVLIAFPQNWMAPPQCVDVCPDGAGAARPGVGPFLMGTAGCPAVMPTRVASCGWSCWAVSQVQAGLRGRGESGSGQEEMGRSSAIPPTPPCPHRAAPSVPRAGAPPASGECTPRGPCAMVWRTARTVFDEEGCVPCPAGAGMGRPAARPSLGRGPALWEEPVPPSTQSARGPECAELLQRAPLEASSHVGFCAIVLELEISGSQRWSLDQSHQHHSRSW